MYTEEPRAATVTITSDSAQLLKMTKEIYKHIMLTNNKISDDVRLKIATEAVNQCSLLSSVSGTGKEKMISNMHPMHYPAGAIICKQGSHAFSFYIITEGVCGISVHSAESDNSLPDITDEHSETILLRRLYPGDCFGK